MANARSPAAKLAGFKAMSYGGSTCRAQCLHHTCASATAAWSLPIYRAALPTLVVTHCHRQSRGRIVSWAPQRPAWGHAEGGLFAHGLGIRLPPASGLEATGTQERFKTQRTSTSYFFWAMFGSVRTFDYSFGTLAIFRSNIITLAVGSGAGRFRARKTNRKKKKKTSFLQASPRRSTFTVRFSTVLCVGASRDARRAGSVPPGRPSRPQPRAPRAARGAPPP